MISIMTRLSRSRTSVSLKITLDSLSNVRRSRQSFAAFFSDVYVSGILQACCSLFRRFTLSNQKFTHQDSDGCSCIRGSCSSLEFLHLKSLLCDSDSFLGANDVLDGKRLGNKSSITVHCLTCKVPLTASITSSKWPADDSILSPGAASDARTAIAF